MNEDLRGGLYRSLLVLIVLMIVLGTFDTSAQTNAPKSQPPQDAGALITTRLKQVQDKSYRTLGEQFALVWDSNLSAEHKLSVTQTLQQMDKRNLPDYPFLGSYVRLILAYSQTDEPIISFDEWHDFFSIFLRSRPQTQQIEEVQRISEGLVGGGWIHRSETFGWRLEKSQDFKIGLNNNKTPAFRISKATIWCVAMEDSFAIQAESVSGQLIERKINLVSGRSDWSRLGLPSDSIYAILNQVDINLKTPWAKCDSALLFTTSLKQKLTGMWQDRIRTGRATDEEPNHPRFESNTPVGTIPARLPKSVTLGNYSLIGRRYALRTFGDRQASLSWRPDPQTEVVVAASSIFFSPTRIVSPFASVVIRRGGDSIQHPGISFEYQIETDEMWLRMPLKTPNLSPFILSIPQVQAYCEQLYWKKGIDTLQFKVYLGRNDSTALFVSTSYFDPREFLSITSASGSNELWTFIQYILRTGEEVVAAGDYARTMRMTSEAVQNLFIQLAQAGFVGYDQEEQLVRVLPKLERYFNKSDENSDYDHIKILSNPASGLFAQYILSTGSLQIEGVRAVALNDSHSVILHPKNGKIIVNREYNIKWSGRFTAGPLAFEGKTFSFDYQKNQVRVDSARSLTLFSLSDDRDERGRWKRIPLRTVLQDISGLIQIDAPNMKSARKPDYNFPHFNTIGPSFVYFDDPSIQGGAYNRKDFFYRIDEFSLGRLDFDDALDSLRLQGELVSPTFPPIREPLRLMPDFSLGFTSPFMAGGRPVHGDKARADVALSLDGSGLTGSGSFYFLNSEIRSDSLVFLPGLTRGPVRRMKVRNDADYGRPAPEFETGEGKFEWRPESDSLSVFALQNSFQVFDGQTEFTGDFSLTPSHLMASGTLNRGAQRVASKEFDWKRQSWSARFCRIEMDRGGPTVPSNPASELATVRLLSADSLKGNMDYRNKEARFESEFDLSPVNLPYNDYSLRLPYLGWNLDSAAVVLGRVHSGGMEKIMFLATDPESDSIQFEATHARLSLQSGSLSLFGIDHIPCADAWIYPPNGTVQIGRKSKIQPMEGARIVWDSLARAHEAIEVKVSINSRKSYLATGYYNYLVEGEATQRIRLKEISVDSFGISRASARVYRDSGFVMAPGIGFGGTIDIQGDSVGLLFSGVGGLKYMQKAALTSYFKIDTRYNPKTDKGVHLSHWVDGSGKPLYTGLFLNASRAFIYPLMLGKKRNPSDSALAYIETGTIVYNRDSSQYKLIEPKNRTSASHELHQFMFSPSDSMFTASGRLWCLSQSSSKQWLSLAGNMQHNLMNQETTVDALMFVRDVLPKRGFEYFGGLLSGNYFRMTRAVTAADWFESALSALIPADQESELLLNYRLSKQLPQDPMSPQTWCFALQPMRWDSDERSFSASKQLGVIRAGGEFINKHYPSFVEFRRLPKSEMFNLLVMPERDKDLLIQYRNGSFYTYSTDPDYTKLFEEERSLVKKKQKELYRESDESTFYQVLSRKESLDASFVDP
ncbi:MAG: hypothetical protein ACO3GN_01330 [Bacteroidia bacterium]